MRKVYIAGFGQTDRGRHPEKDWRRYIFEAYSELKQNAFEDPTNEIGHVWLALYPATACYQFTASHPTVDVLGLASKCGCTSSEKACTSSHDALHGAFLGVASGLYDCALVVGSGKYCDSLNGGFAALAESNFILAQMGILDGLDRAREGGGEDYLRTYVGDDDMYGLYYSWMYYAVRQPKGMVHKQPIKSREEYDRIPYDTFPFRFGAAGSRFADGGSAILLASEEAAKRYTKTPVEIAGIASVDDSMVHTHRIQYHPWEGGVVPAVKGAWDKAFKMARVRPADLDVFQPHDNSPMKSWKHMEMLGHPDIPLGQGPKWYTSGESLPGGRLPAATAGQCRGGYVEACVSIDQMIENVLQLTGRAGGRQVPIKNGIAAGIISTIRVGVHVLRVQEVR